MTSLPYAQNQFNHQIIFFSSYNLYNQHIKERKIFTVNILL